MPLLHESAELPAWSELRDYRIDRGTAGQRLVAGSHQPRQKLVVVTGSVVHVGADEPRVLKAGEQLDLKGPGRVTIEYLEPGATVWMAGAWGETTGNSGLFSVVRSERPRDVGDAVAYPKETDFDSHYHDCDEYWIIVSGKGTAVSEGQAFEVGPGDCVATRMGDHHDFPRVEDPISAVFFETTLAGQGRRGHLWEHTHGQAAPTRGVA